MMKSNWKIILVAISCLAIWGCQRTKTPDVKDVLSVDEYRTLLNQSVLVIADSLATAEDLKLKQALLEIVFSKVLVKDNEYILTVDRDYYEQLDIPVYYYDLLVYEFKETSDALKKMRGADSIPAEQLDLKMLYESAKKEYWEARGMAPPPLESIDK